MEKQFADIVEKARTLSGEERTAYLDSVCAGDPDLTRKVQERLTSISETTPTPEGSPDTMTSLPPDSDTNPTLSRNKFAGSPDFASPLIGSQIGPYRLEESLGEGGMGLVFLALQEEPVRRHVAIKIIKPGLASNEIMRRFAAEEQALAMMNHRNIAKMYEAGMTDQGLSYFVMEHVPGKPITRYCDDHQLPTRSRLELFTQVCAAIQHAHQKGIIHRDIKPSNILVTETDGGPEVKVIDFGIAKALHASLTQQTLETEIGQVIGTLEYMSPEQANFSTRDIDTRSDVYSLGVLLHELITGKKPLSIKDLETPNLFAIQRMILEGEPKKPSTLISRQAGPEVEAIAKCRGTSIDELKRSIDGDLDWILLKALDKDRSHRYQSPQGLKEDMVRYLDGQVVLAGSPSTWYRFKKYARRHRVVVAFAGLILAALVSTFFGISHGLIQAREANAKAETTIALLEELLVSVEPEREGPNLKVTTLLDSFESRLAQVTDRDVKTRLSKTFAKTYNMLGEDEKAVALYRSVLETLDPSRAADHLAIIRVENQMYRVLLEGTPTNAIKDQIHAVVAKSTSWLGLTHAETLVASWNLAAINNKLGLNDEAYIQAQSVLSHCKKVYSPFHPETIRTMMLLSSILTELGRPDASLEMEKDILAMCHRAYGAEHPKTLTAKSNYASGLYERGAYLEAYELFQECLPQVTRVFGEDHPQTVAVAENLALTYSLFGQYEEALALFEGLLASSIRKVGEHHIQTLWIKESLADVYSDAGRYEEALALIEQTFAQWTRELGADHPETLWSQENLALIYADMGRFEEAIRTQTTVVRARKNLLGEAHPDVHYSLALLRMFEAHADTAKALARFDQAFAQVQLADERFSALLTLVQLLRRVDREEHAGPYYAQLFDLFKDTIGFRQPRAQTFLQHYHAFCVKQGQAEKAEQLQGLMEE
ncbi:tetratricopeptide repeat-containing serine/threonine-protein kinase [Sulfidibacter corallicola]|uniref:Serine/threonine protein kinase n=1 Tax=Sulfidibacter corallicola TaxID=2818388 RepID=A0A8A4TJM0_SULCO|nr:tetratricopeptide repeat-containing serine/threonine-protein kinase [Sulfidibacter corallicola]QTD50229.1 serine/threonine protein kinase [Sulfidibacter corallicola]